MEVSLIYQKDQEIIELRRITGLTNRELGNLIGVHPNTIGQKILGFCCWQGTERKRLIRALTAIKEKQQPK